MSYKYHRQQQQPSPKSQAKPTKSLSPPLRSGNNGCHVSLGSSFYGLGSKPGVAFQKLPMTSSPDLANTASDSGFLADGRKWLGKPRTKGLGFRMNSFSDSSDEESDNEHTSACGGPISLDFDSPLSQSPAVRRLSRQCNFPVLDKSPSSSRRTTPNPSPLPARKSLSIAANTHSTANFNNSNNPANRCHRYDSPMLLRKDAAETVSSGSYSSRSPHLRRNRGSTSDYFSSLTDSFASEEDLSSSFSSWKGPSAGYPEHCLLTSSANKYTTPNWLSPNQEADSLISSAPKSPRNWTTTGNRNHHFAIFSNSPSPSPQNSSLDSSTGTTNSDHRTTHNCRQTSKHSIGAKNYAADCSCQNLSNQLASKFRHFRCSTVTGGGGSSSSGESGQSMADPARLSLISPSEDNNANIAMLN